MKSAIALFLAALCSCAALAQSGSGTRVTGSFGQSFQSAFSYLSVFTCTGEPTCTGTYLITYQFPGICSNPIVLNGTVTITGLNLNQPGPIQGTYGTANNPPSNFTINNDGTCAFTLNTAVSSGSVGYNGTWDGKTGQFSLPGSDGAGNPVQVPVTFTAQRSSIPPPPPPFPMTVSGGIVNGVANVQAAIQYRPQDVGTAGSVYVFALAPASRVRASELALFGKSTIPEDPPRAQDTPIQCVLAQLTASGQLVSVTSSTLAAYLSGTLGSAGAAVNVINNASTVNIQGSVFYVGYGASSTAMLNGGINRSAITIPGSQVCQPQAPETGWWWNKNEPGRGFSIETQGSHIFMAGYLYDASGRSTWVVSGGLTSLDGSLYNGALQTFANGQTLTGNYQAPGAPATAGTLTLAFSDARNGTLSWPGGTIPIERFAIAPPATGAAAFVPEAGWWWSPTESGRGYFVEISNNVAFIAGYMYDPSGNPLWYLASGTLASLQSFQGSWAQYANGQTLTGAYKPNALVNGNVGSVGIVFQTSSTAILTLPGGRTVPITRFAF